MPISSRPHRIPHPSHDPSCALRQPSIIPRPDAERLRQKTSPPPRAASRRLQHPFQRKKPPDRSPSPRHRHHCLCPQVFFSIATTSGFISSLSPQAQILPQGSTRLQQSTLHHPLSLSRPD
ncbi:hypothetical protein MRB53_023458 [Persea americana]|uniref:Uncharacterized protein n=1 Tax=Persea americana TaxID=3435 RepID=A0ACC2L9M7_PERAE|nr:hypothetical protein MRB53_023458 [Persea americana]